MSQTSEGAPVNRMDESKNKAARRGKAAREFSRYHALAIEIAVAVIAPTLLGRWLDSKTGNGPWFMIAGMILGGAASIRSAQKAYKESQKDAVSGGGSSNKEQPE